MSSLVVLFLSSYYWFVLLPHYELVPLHASVAYVQTISSDVARASPQGFKIYFTLFTVTDSRMSPDLPRGTGKSIGGGLDVDDEDSEQHRFKPVQSLHHGSVGYQTVHAGIGLAKKAMSLQANREHNQEQERTISNCRND
jgi:hypothetical protein